MSEENETPVAEKKKAQTQLTPEQIEELSTFLEVPDCKHFLDIAFGTVTRFVVGFGVNGMHFRMQNTGTGKVYNQSLGLDLDADFNDDHICSVRRGAFISCIVKLEKIKVKEEDRISGEMVETDKDVWMLQYIHANGSIRILCPDRKLALYYRSYFWAWIHGSTEY